MEIHVDKLTNIWRSTFTVKQEKILVSFFVLYVGQLVVDSVIMLHGQVCWSTINQRFVGRTPDLEALGVGLAHRVVSLDKELYSTLSLFTNVYNVGTGDILLGGNAAMD